MKTHQTKTNQEKHNNDEIKQHKRKRTSTALAVKGTQKHCMDKDYMKKRRDFIVRGQAVQIYMLEVMQRRGNNIDEVYGNTKGQTEKWGTET